MKSRLIVISVIITHQLASIMKEDTIPLMSCTSTIPGTQDTQSGSRRHYSRTKLRCHQTVISSPVRQTNGTVGLQGDN